MKNRISRIFIALLFILAIISCHSEKQGLLSASCFWVGSEVLIDSIRPTYWKRYDDDFPFAQRIDSVIAWLQKMATLTRFT